MAKRNYLDNLSNSLVDNSEENIVQKKSNEIENIIGNENKPHEAVEDKDDNNIINNNISNKYRSRNDSSKIEKPAKKEKKIEDDPLLKFSPSVRKILQKNNDLAYADTTNTKISNEANKALKIISLSSEVAGYKIMSSLLIDFYNKHGDEFKL